MNVSDTTKGEMEIECDDDDESERFPETFVCCICRDLLYKPVVLACGHISCFWCVHRSMSGLHKSRCPICRNQYLHFPFICQTLHLLLLKMHPSAYKRRENQTLEEEKDTGFFSPQINGPLVHELQPVGTIIEHAAQSCFHPETGLKNMIDPRKDITSTAVTTASDRNSNQIQSNGTCQEISVDDVLCGSCNSMLFRPIVLNCGHAFCECCIVPQTNEMTKCEVCQNLHPGGILKVCLDFDHFLEERFPMEYELRRANSQMKQEQLPSETLSKCSSEAGKESSRLSFSPGDDPLQWWNASSKVHIGVGCDSCGMYPIVGDRYRCKDCVEQIGYDLCNDCYTTTSKLPGRFNQQHTSDHTFEIVKSNPMQNIMLRLLRGQLQEASTISDALNENSGAMNEIRSPENATEDGENMVDAVLPSSESEPNQRGNE